MHEPANSTTSRISKRSCRTDFFDNLTMKEALHLTHQHSNHVSLTKMLTNDNHILADNQSHLSHNCSPTNTVELAGESLSLKFSEFIASSSRHDCVGECTSTSTSSAAVLSYSVDRINNIIGPDATPSPSSSSSHGVGIMSHKNFMLSLDPQHQSTHTGTATAQVFVGNSETLMSPAEAPFGRRYAEISQFKNHPNVEWSIEEGIDNDGQEEQQTPESFYDDVVANDNCSKSAELAMDMNKDKSDDEELLLAKEFESAAESSSDGVLAEGEDETSSESEEEEFSGSPSPQCDISLLERLLRTHPVWFLPSLQRGGSVHLLQGKEIGTFIVRGSSQKDTMAISVRLPRDAGPYIEHYLIQSNDGLLNLESSRFKFESIPALVAHYSNCCDELPVQLCLPGGLREAKNRQQLMSLALLGSEFWRCAVASCANEDETSLNSQMKSPTETSGISTMAESKHKNSIFNNNNAKVNLRGGVHNTNNHPQQQQQQQQQMVETPSDTASSFSSFPASSTLLSPQSVDNVFIASPSNEFCNLKQQSSSNSINNLNSPSGIIGKTSTFKGSMTANTPTTPAFHPDFPPPSQQQQHHDGGVNKKGDENGNSHNEEFVQRTRPTPPNTLNLAIASRAPIPPKRWLKPTSPFVEQTSNSNFTVTTTVTINVAKQQQHHTSEIEIPPRNVPVISERLSPEGGESRTNSDTSLQKWEQISKPSPLNPFKSESMRSKRGGSSRRKDASSSHYQESDILESPSVYMDYCRSNLGDKISDYEDLWTQENNSRSSLHIPLDNNKNDIISSTTTTSTTNSNNSSGGIVSKESDSALVGNEVAITTICTTPLQPVVPLVDGNMKSPFYSDPVDAVVVPVFPQITRREPRLNPLPSFHRYSEPPKGQFEDLNFHASPTSPLTHEKGLQQPLIAASLDHLKSISSNNNKSIGGNNHRVVDPTWAVDSSWEFVDKNDDSSESSSVRNLRHATPQNSLRRPGVAHRKPPQQTHTRLLNTIERNQCAMSVDSYLMNSKKSNIYKMVARKYPDINLRSSVGSGGVMQQHSHIPSTWQTFDSDNGSNKFQRLSSYDNVIEQQSIYGGSEDGTLFSEPWDSSQWDSFFPTTEDSSTIHLSKCRPAISEDETIIEDSSAISRSNANTIQRNPLLNTHKVATVLRHRSGCFKDREILKHPRNKTEHNDPGEGVEAYTLSLAQDETSVFAKNIHNFIACTRESKEKIPQKVMRNMRQFMNGMKNYLVKHGEKDFGIEVEKARAALKSDEFLNLDQILEGVMHQLVIMPLREHLHELFVDYYGSTGDIELIVNNVKFGENKDAQAFGVRKGLRTPTPPILSHISMVFAKLQEAELPFEKLSFLLNAVTMILDNTSDPESKSSDVRHLGCDDFLPLLAYVICKCGFHFAEIEAEYMWGLLQPTLMIGQAGYYVTSLCSAAISLKEFKARLDQEHNNDGTRVPNIPLECSVLRIIIPDEYNGSIQTKTIPVRPHTTTKEVCRIIAHKSQITNPMDYGLFKLVDGEETLLMDNDCPQEIRLASAGKHCMLAYKRFDAKIAWPKQ